MDTDVINAERYLKGIKNCRTNNVAPSSMGNEVSRARLSLKWAENRLKLIDLCSSNMYICSDFRKEKLDNVQHAL